MRDARFGRIWLPTIMSDIAEAVGDTLESVGGGVVPGERRARSFNITLPIHGTYDDGDPYKAGYTIRRQLRSLMENTRAKLQATYFRFDPDDELNAWLVVGGGDLAYAQGGIAVADFELRLSDAFRVASLRTHRPARRVELYDRRLSTTPRDILGTIFSTDFSGYTPLALTYLPVGVSDITGRASRVVTTLGSRTTAAGALTVVEGAAHAEVLSYEWDSDSIHAADDVVIHDRRGMSGEPPSGYAATVLGDTPVAYYRHDEVPGATTMVDWTTNLLTGSYVGTPNLGLNSAVSGSDSAVGLSGQQDLIYGKVADTALIDFAGDFTIEGWIAPRVGTPNLVPNPSLEEIWGWWANAISGTLTSFTTNTAWSVLGATSARVLASITASTGRAEASTHQILTSENVYITALPNVNYTADATVNVATGVTGTEITIKIEFLNSSDGVISSITSTPISSATSGVKTPTVNGTSPVGTVGARFHVRMTGTGTTPSTWTADFRMDQMMMYAGTGLTITDLRPRYDVIVSKWRSTTSGRSYRFYYDAYLQKLFLDVSTNGSSTVSLSVDLSLPTQTWSHLGVSYTASGGIANFYRNGTLIGSTSGGPATIFTSALPLVVGKWETDAS